MDDDQAGFTLATFAAWLEGEGCFQAYERGGRTAFAISASSTDLDVLGHVIRFAGGAIASVKQAQPQHRPCWAWKLTGREAVLEMAAALRPHMLSERRRAAIDAMLDMAERRPAKKRYAGTAPHGSVTRYRNGCRCRDCTSVASAASLAQSRRRGVPPRVKHRYCKRGHDQTQPGVARPAGKGCAVCHREGERARYRAVAAVTSES